MQCSHYLKGGYLVLQANGRLDATWSEFFSGICLSHIRNGNHHLVVDAEGLSFLSSAGIRSLLLIYKELTSVNGSLLIIRANPFVAKTVEMTGFKQWLAESLPQELLDDAVDSPQEAQDEGEIWVLDPTTSMEVSVLAAWQPWEPVVPEMIVQQQMNHDVFALGVGSAASDPETATGNFGDFVALAGHVILQPPDEKARPDYLIAEQSFVPELNVIQSLTCTGKLSHLFRFASENPGETHGIADIASKALSVTKSGAAAVVILAEIGHLVGATIVKSPDRMAAGREISFPEIRSWLSFCGEHVFTGHQAIVFGVVAETNSGKDWKLMRTLPAQPRLSGHFHAAVFPYQPLQNGKIDLIQQIRKYLNGPPPEALLHLIDDQRPTIGLGQSALIRGACWCAPVKNVEELI
jgi:anti-anti-sigma factor